MHSDQPGRFSIPGSGLERPEAAQKQKQPNEPSLWVRFWLEQFLGCFWFSIPVPKRYRIFETKSVTKSEINCEHDLDEVRLARHLSQAPVKLSTAEAAKPPVQHFEAQRSHKNVIRLDERHTCPLSNIIIFDSDAQFIMPRPSETASAP